MGVMACVNADEERPRKARPLDPPQGPPPCSSLDIASPCSHLDRPLLSFTPLVVSQPAASHHHALQGLCPGAAGRPAGWHLCCQLHRCEGLAGWEICLSVVACRASVGVQSEVGWLAWLWMGVISTQLWLPTLSPADDDRRLGWATWPGDGLGALNAPHANP